MPNKIYSDVADYMVEGAKNSGYIKVGKGGFGDASTNGGIVKDYGRTNQSSDNWFEGTKGSKGKGEAS